MSTYDGNSTPAPTTSDDVDGDTRRAQQSRRRLENRRNRHNARAELHRTAQYPIRRLLAGVR
jgi:hypothetical protein